MKIEWILITLMSAGLTLAQEQPNPPPNPPRDEANREPLPPREGDRGNVRRPMPPREGERGDVRPPMPAREGERGEMRRPMPPREGGRGGPEARNPERHMQIPNNPPMDFEAALRREIGPNAEAFKEFAEPLKDRIQQAQRLFQERRFEEGRDMLHGIAAQAREMRELKQRDPERFRMQQQMAEMERRSVELGQRVRRAPDDEAKKSATTELKELLNKLFESRQQEREKSLQQLEREVKEVREALEKRKARRDEMIQHRFDQLTGRTEVMEW
ncbi:MAG: hypothetical protein NTY01_21985 [Verrucomicrobia bacterium]|nr:hypothetical protein [Verrucomicrobiota bacterium]